MNLVIGPNGSGKSTIVCAICLGLGYPPTVLGRATATGDYVQHGKDSAEIEIELADENNKSITIRRKLLRDKNLSTYYINGSLCSETSKLTKDTRIPMPKSKKSWQNSTYKSTIYGATSLAI